MSLCRILIDSNVYFRLAQTLHPLLNSTFGEKRCCLFIIKQLQAEYDKSLRLKNTFPWVNDPEYVENRSNVLEVTKEEKIYIIRAYDFILDFVRNVYPGVSKVDVCCLAHAEQLGIPVVTDDGDMRTVAENYKIRTYKTIELLKLMLDCGYIDMDKIRNIARYWKSHHDLPGDFFSDYKRLFGELPPK
jgi:hypothetical protein